jgi:hypothetical protein
LSLSTQTLKQHALRQTLAGLPHTFGLTRTRWSLATLLAALPWLRLTSTSGLHHLFKRRHITWQHSRWSIHSPDQHYQAKLACVQAVRMLTRLAPEKIVVL